MYAQFLAKFILNEYKGLLKKYKYNISNTPIHPTQFGLLTRCCFMGIITRQELKNIIDKMLYESR